MLRCSKCKMVKEETEFSRNRSKATGHNSVCKECQRAASKEYWARNGHKYAKGGEKEREHKPETPQDVATRKRYVEANRERLNARQRQYYADHREQRKQYYDANRNTILARRRAYVKANIEQLTAKSYEYAERYPERIEAAKAVRDAIKRKQIKPAKKCKCADCGQKAEHLHHESYAPEKWLDVVPLCRSCHRKRHIMSKQV